MPGASTKVLERGAPAVLEGTAEGTIFKSKRVEGRGEEDLFAMVDELSAAIRDNFEVAARPEVPAKVEAVTTASLQAWRFYSEAIVLNREAKPEEAIARLEKAVELDPSFALSRSYRQRHHERRHDTTQLAGAGHDRGTTT